MVTWTSWPESTMMPMLTSSSAIMPSANPAPGSVSRWRIQGGRCATGRRRERTAVAMAQILPRGTGIDNAGTSSAR